MRKSSTWDHKGPPRAICESSNLAVQRATGTKRIGRHDQFCVLNDPGQKSQMTECVRTYTLPGGEINSEGVSTRSTLNASQKPGGTDAISGGTGKYVGVRGEMRFGSRGNKVIQTFHFTDQLRVVILSLSEAQSREGWDVAASALSLLALMH